MTADKMPEEVWIYGKFKPIQLSDRHNPDAVKYTRTALIAELELKIRNESYNAGLERGKELSRADLSTPVPDNVAVSIVAIEKLLSMRYFYAEDAIHMRKLLRAASTPSTPTVSEEDKARALEALQEISGRLYSALNQLVDDENAPVWNNVKEDIAAIKKLLLPTPRGEVTQIDVDSITGLKGGLK